MSPAHVRPALAALLESLRYATEFERDPWDFAVEIVLLRELGLSNSDLRWLLCKGWVRHATETAEGDTRSFTPVAPLVLDDRCCFVLTAAGEEAMRGEVGGTPAPAVPGLTAYQNEAHASCVPQWDKDRRLLRYAGRVVKQFKVPAPNQEVILVAFQEEGWTVRIDDPLPMAALIDPKRRLHDTINSLNRNQLTTLLRFFGDGSGEGVCWEPARELVGANGFASGVAAGA